MFQGVEFEKDPFFTSLNHQVFSKLSEVHNEIAPKEEPTLNNSVRFVSFEDALKELVSLKNSL